MHLQIYCFLPFPEHGHAANGTATAITRMAMDMDTVTAVMDMATATATVDMDTGMGMEVVSFVESSAAGASESTANERTKCFPNEHHCFQQLSCRL